MSRFFGWLKGRRTWFLAAVGALAAGIGALGVRASRSDGDPATWGAWDRGYDRSVVFSNRLQGAGELLNEAAGAWNKAIGCEAVRVVGPEDPADVPVAWWEGEACGRLDDLPAGKQGALFMRGGCWEIRVKSPNGMDAAFLQRVIAHELGHVLGLDHSKGGLMAATMGPLAPLVPSKAQAAAIRERICK